MKGTKKILDRITVSQTLTCADIETKGMVAKTNHRPVIAKILTVTMIPDARSAMINQAPKRLKQPAKLKADEAITKMNERLDEAFHTNCYVAVYRQ